ncbi:MAG: polysaccharide biosynthesis/export family protein [Leptolyngbyaceae cyanobacterium MAG.088]|nr:polysaccharide biosynthesis/export family protein [Leptolyngbyaceae cyanobacterium MAG.088]
MVAVKNAPKNQYFLKKQLALLASPIVLGATCWSFLNTPTTAQSLPPLSEESLEESVPVEVPVDPIEPDETLLDVETETDVPTVEVLQRRPTLDDLEPRIRNSSTPVGVEDIFEEYRLGPGDGIFVSVQRFPDLSFQATLDQQGNVILPIEGAVPLEGLTLNEAENRIRAVYNQYVVLNEVRSIGLANTPQGIPYQAVEEDINRFIRPDYQTLRANNPGRYGVPDVTLTLTAQRGVEVMIFGEIERPGLYPLQVPRVTAALLAAGGARSTADLREIRIQRRLPDNRVIEKTVDLYTPVREGIPLPEERLENGDVVIIARLDPAQSQDYDVNLVTRSTFAQPEILVRVFNYPGGVVRGQRLPNGSTFVDALVGDSVRGGGGLGLPLNQANLDSVALIRFDPEEGKPVIAKLDAKDAIYGDPTQNPPLRDNDVIVVGRSFINRISFAIDTITQPFQDVLSFILFFDGIFNGDFFD